MNIIIEQDREGKECISYQDGVRCLPNNTKRNRKKYKRHIRRMRNAYFKQIVEDKMYNTPQFYDTLYDWYYV
jgi:hypothetical protein